MNFNSIRRFITSTTCCVSITTTSTNSEIYPSELVLKNTTNTSSEISYLDTTINIGEENGTVRIGV